MKTNLSKQTKYFRKIFSAEKKDFVLIEFDPFAKANWIYAQIDATIRTTFYKYDIQIPPFVIVEELTHYIVLYIVRPKVTTEKELCQWVDKYIYIQDELNRQAKCNSNEYEDTEDWIKYEFKIL